MTKRDRTRRGQSLAPGCATHFLIIIIDGPGRPSSLSQTVFVSANRDSPPFIVLFFAKPMAAFAPLRAISYNDITLYTTYTRAAHCVPLLIFLPRRSRENRKPETTSHSRARRYFTVNAQSALSRKQGRDTPVLTNDAVQRAYPTENATRERVRFALFTRALSLSLSLFLSRLPDWNSPPPPVQRRAVCTPTRSTSLSTRARPHQQAPLRETQQRSLPPVHTTC